MSSAQARAVIIGGGIMGCGLAYHLAREGWTDTVLVEKGELTSGSTWHAAGQITYATSHHALGKCIAYNLDLYRRLETETGQSVTWHSCGSLRLAYDKDESDWLRHIMSVGRGWGLPMEIIAPRRIRQLHPFYALDGVKEALHTPADGHLDPAGAAFALAAGAKKLGVKIIRHCRATNIAQKAGGEWRVSTEQGDIDCEHLINAGGVYARQMALWNHYDLPAVSMTHHYFVTEPAPEFESLAAELPVVRDDKMVSGYIRMEQKSGLIGIYEKQNPNAVWLDGAPWESENELFEPHYERVSPWLEHAMARMPIFARLGIKRAVHGAISHPPDGNPLIGPAPGLRNYWCCCGCQIGVGWGPGLTRELARWMARGAADINMREFDPRRFGAFAGRDYQIAKAKEDYSLRHEVPFPHFNRLAARPTKTGALYERLKEKGAVFEEVYGRERPRWFAAGGVEAIDRYSFRRTPVHAVVAAEVAAVRGRAGVMDISAFAKVEVSGKNAPQVIDRLVANRLPATGKIVLAHILGDNGRIELEITVAGVSEEKFYLVCAAFFEQRLLDCLRFARRDGEQVTVNNVSEQWSALALNGPLARDIFAECGGNVDDDSWLRVVDAKIAGHCLRVLRLSYVGENGWEFHGEHQSVAAVYDALWAAGEKYGLADYGSFAMNAMRMEKMFKGASELTNEVTLPEAGVMHFAQLDKAGFIGQTATAAAMKKPPRWRCVYLQVDDDGERDGHGGEAVLAGGEVVGAVSSIAYGHFVGKLLAFAFVKPRFSAPDTELEIVIMGAARPARVLARAVYDPDNKKPKGETP